MSKKPIIILFSGILISTLLFSPATSYADQFYLSFPPSCFTAGDEGFDFQKLSTGEYLIHNDTSDAYYFTPVQFNRATTSTHYIKSISIRYYDGFTDGYISVELIRQNLFNGARHTVKYWSSGLANTTSSNTVSHAGTLPGYKLVDTLKFSYYLKVLFYRDGDVNPGSNLRLYQVRIHYGT